jgi:hypothetical protein
VTATARTLGARRVATIGAAFLGTLLVAGWWFVLRYGSEAIAAGSRAYAHWRGFRALLDPADGPVDVLWLGDSTVLPTGPAGKPYPELVQDRRLAPKGLRSIVVATRGLDFYGYYGLMGGALARTPRVVVMIANLRSFDPSGFRSFNELMAYVPPAELPRLLMLPYAVRGMTAPRLLLAQLLRVDAVSRAMLLLAGMHDAVEPSAGDGEETGTITPQELATLWARQVREWDRPFDRGHPMVRFAAETAAMATRRGVPVVVVVTPMPIESLRAQGLYDAERVARRIGVLHDALHMAGAEVCDLHDALPPSAFSDPLGHFTPDGHETMERLVAVDLDRSLGRHLAAP